MLLSLCRCRRDARSGEGFGAGGRLRRRLAVAHDRLQHYLSTAL